ncbi:hypothetical protein I3842_06G090900 [Carya illinoinensis]|uniref:Uncharacterized protein n=1 Tax=Carya illinoinensis TaxID=32201 RepID=A0A922EV98_CARIL|nr:hypothetical protein I3842_06G090900 [Carya illinoinensis]
MKSSPFSTSTLIFLRRPFLVFLLLFVVVSASRLLSNPTILFPAAATSSRNSFPHPQYTSCGSLSHEKTRSLCFQLQRIHKLHGSSLPPPISSAQPNEIDPRYGVEKRLVPSGPNPLHN